jgi:hypothetical protein
MAKKKYCCGRFADGVDNNEITFAGEKDETEWIINNLWHIYYCPFCGSPVKGNGWGEYDKNMGRKPE